MEQQADLHNAKFERYVKGLDDLKKELTREKDKKIMQLLSEIEKLKSENESLKIELLKFSTKKKYKARKDVFLNERTLNKFINFFESSIENKEINHTILKKEIENHINNLSDRDVLYFILQQAIHKNGLLILSEKQIREGVESAKNWTKGTQLDRKTIALSLASLQAQKIIFRYRFNKHKAVTLINTSKNREIFQKLQTGEITLRDLIIFLGLELKRKGLPSSVNNLVKERDEINSALEIKKIIYPESSASTISNLTIKMTKQTIAVDQEAEQKAEEKIRERELKLEALMEIWKISNQMAASLSPKKFNLNFYDKKEALKIKIRLMGHDIISANESSIKNEDFVIQKARFFQRLDKTMAYINYQGVDSNYRDLLESVLTSIDTFLL
jgi:hypothetical protein